MAITRTVFITGGARRIGMAVAKYLHASGYNIIITYNKSGLEAKSLSKRLNKLRPNSFATIKASFTSKKIRYRNISVNIIICIYKLFTV